jgi:hypothetical protein
MADVLDLQDLVKALQELDELHGLDREQRGRELVAVARASVTAAADEGCWQATRPRGSLTRKEAAEALGTSMGLVSDAVSRHNARLRQVDRKAEPKPRKSGRKSAA